jgi:hypothetical protein
MFEKLGSAQTQQWGLDQLPMNINVTNPLQNCKRRWTSGPQDPDYGPVKSTRSAISVTLTANY